MSSYVHHYTLTSALGTGLSEMQTSLRENRSGLTNIPWPDSEVPCFLGRVEIPGEVIVPAERSSRNNRLIELALQQDGFAEFVAAELSRLDPGRCGLVMGTSTSSIDRTEEAYRQLDDEEHFSEGFQQPNVHNPHAPCDFVAERLGIDGPRMTISAACASSAKVFAAAERWLEQDIVDAVIVGGADSLCLSVIYGFHSLQLIAPEPCRPFAVDRQGISLGEAAGFALLSRIKGESDIELLGVGESCDAYHMSSAHPDGLGARLSMQRALNCAGLTMDSIDYVNLHGTGTRANDSTEGKICGELMRGPTVASATKGWTGHTLGAAGIVEAVLSMNALKTGFLPGTQNTREPEAPFNILLESESRDIHTCLSNSFGFGGNNCSVVFGRL